MNKLHHLCLFLFMTANAPFGGVWHVLCVSPLGVNSLVQAHQYCVMGSDWLVK